MQPFWHRISLTPHAGTTDVLRGSQAAAPTHLGPEKRLHMTWPVPWQSASTFLRSSSLAELPTQSPGWGLQSPLAQRVQPAVQLLRFLPDSIIFLASSICCSFSS
jgi:hypothetical protein